MESLGHPGAGLQPHQTQGRTFMDISAQLDRDFGPMEPSKLARLPLELREVWLKMVHQAEALPGALAAVRGAAAHFKLAIVSSSHTPYLNQHLERLGMSPYFPSE